MSRRSEIERAVRSLAPAIPRHELAAVADHALDSPGLRRASPQAAAWLSLVAYARHVFTDYDALLAEGTDADAARFFVLDEINAVLADWGCRKRVSGEEADDTDGGPGGRGGGW